VIGQEFRADTLLAISDLTPDSLQDALSHLLKTELIVADSAAPLARFAFNHALVRDAAYKSLLNRDRRQFHAKVAAALEAQNSAGHPVEPELLAHHYAEAGIPRQALKFWRLAAQQALQRSANVEAFHHTETAIALLQAQPDTPERRRMELDFRLLAGSAAWAVKGFGAPEVEETFTRARELAAEVGDPAQVVIALRGLFGCYYARGLAAPMRRPKAWLRSRSRTQAPATSWSATCCAAPSATGKAVSPMRAGSSIPRCRSMIRPSRRGASCPRRSTPG
jgi:hypothetical protein